MKYFEIKDEFLHSNRTAKNNITASYDAQDRIKNYGNTVYTFNDHGDVAVKTNGPQITTYSFDVFGQLKTVNLPTGSSISYKTDGENKRFARILNGVVNTLYSYNNQGQLVSEHNADGTLRSRYIYGTQAHSPDYMIKDNVKYSLIKDHLGSVRIVMNSATGAIAQQLSYDEFGIVTQDTNPQFQTFGYAGGLYDSSTGLLRFGAREYDAESGRWLQKDPIRFQGGDTNLYGYVGQDPINWTDPTGLARGDLWDPRTYILPVVEAVQGATDFARNYSDMREANTIGADKYFHCMANCQSSQRGPGGQSAAIGISEGRELFDQYIKGDSTNACNADRAANTQGQSGASGGSCSQTCGSLRPNGLGTAR